MVSMIKKLLFSVTAKDCDWSYYVGPGNGGQKKQKTKSGVMCTHRVSGAQARAHEDRMQLRNKEAAFKKMVETPTFKAWHKMEIARLSGEPTPEPIEDVVDRQMKEVNIETKNERGEWIPEQPPPMLPGHWELRGSHLGCNYLGTPGSICNKCGQLVPPFTIT